MRFLCRPSLTPTTCSWRFQHFCTGSSHDSVAFRMSNIGRAIEMGLIPLGFCIALDDAYATSLFSLTPFRKGMNNEYLESFNYFFSSLRGHVEQAFGRLVAKWRILRAPLCFSLPIVTQLIKVCALIHNFAKETTSTPPPLDPEKMSESCTSLQKWLRWCQDDVDEDAWMGSIEFDSRPKAIQRALSLSSTRMKLLIRLERYGILETAWETNNPVNEDD